MIAVFYIGVFLLLAMALVAIGDDHDPDGLA